MGAGATLNLVVAAEVTLRLAEPVDRRDLERLAQLEGRRLPPGPHLIAVRGGETQALICLTTAQVLADPFQPTADLRRLLELRARQQVPRRRRRRRRHAIRASAWARA